MKKVYRKTDEEREAETEYREVTVNSTGEYYFVCTLCDTAFFGEDTFLKSVKGHSYKCPLTSKTFFGSKPCTGSLYGGDEDSFHRHYRITDE